MNGRRFFSNTSPASHARTQTDGSCKYPPERVSITGRHNDHNSIRFGAIGGCTNFWAYRGFCLTTLVLHNSEGYSFLHKPGVTLRNAHLYVDHFPLLQLPAVVLKSADNRMLWRYRRHFQLSRHVLHAWPQALRASHPRGASHLVDRGRQGKQLR